MNELCLAKGRKNNDDYSTGHKTNNCDSGKCNPGLWRFYVEFERQQGDINKAKAAFYRGLKCCPWSKGLLLSKALTYFHLPYLGLAFLALGQLRDVGFDELRNIYQVLGERELRIHVDLEDTFDAIEEGERSGGGQSAALPIALPDVMSTDEN